jgi:hypothetical protein
VDQPQHNQQHSAKNPYRNRTKTIQTPHSFMQIRCKSRLLNWRAGARRRNPESRRRTVSSRKSNC